MSQYEVAVLYDPGLELDLEKATNKIEKIFKEADAKIVNTDNWGKRKLAYPIAKQDHAIYVFYTVEVPAEKIGKVEATFNITDEVLRFLISKPDLKAIAKAEAVKAKRKDRENDEAAAKEDQKDEE